jgi:hypothetical protein
MDQGFEKGGLPITVQTIMEVSFNENERDWIKKKGQRRCIVSFETCELH